MKLLTIDDAIAQLPSDLSQLSFIGKMESGIDHLTHAVETAVKSGDTNTISKSLKTTVNAINHKIEDSIHLLTHLGSLAAEISSANLTNLADLLKAIYNLMLMIIHALMPIQEIASAKYPILIPIFAFLNNLPIATLS